MLSCPSQSCYTTFGTKRSRLGERLSLRSMKTPIQSNVFTLRPLRSFQVIHSLAALQLYLRIRGGILGTFALETCEPEASKAEMVPPPLCFSSGNILNVASEHAMLASGVCLACVPPLPNNSPDRAWPDSALPLGMPSTLVEWGVMRLLRSSFVEMRPESRSSSPIFSKGDPRYVRLCWWRSFLLNHHPGFCSFTCTRGRPFGVRGHDHLTLRFARLAFTWMARCPT